jgi:2'-phosphotransferase
MRRNHIHLAQGVPGNGVISGMRTSSQILIYVDIAKALSVGIKFYLSSNGVVLTEGDELGFLSPSFFERVVDARGKLVTGWEGAERGVDLTSDLLEVSAAEAKEPESAIAKELEGMSLKS